MQPDLLGLPPFRERFPWLGADLQTLRNTIRAPRLPQESARTLRFLLPDGDCLLGRLDLPSPDPVRGRERPRGLVVVLHGLGGGSDDLGQRRLSLALLSQGFVVLRLNLRGAGPGRSLARGTYAASCSVDLLPVLGECRGLAAELAPGGTILPLGAVGLSLGGTVLLNALLDGLEEGLDPSPLDALVCISSPLDLPHCAAHMERPRNFLYQRWLVQRLIAQTLADPHGLAAQESLVLQGAERPRTIRAFDALITAPRWGFPGVAAYYQVCSPLPRLRESLLRSHRSLLVHAEDDPWVPVASTSFLAQEVVAARKDGRKVEGRLPEVWISAGGGHNGFHGRGDTATGCWSDRLASVWLARVLPGLR